MSEDAAPLEGPKPETNGKVGKNSPPVTTRFQKGNKGGPGRPSRQGFREFLSEIRDPNTGVDRRYNLWQQLYLMALNNNHRHQFDALQLALAYDMDRPVQGVEMSGPNGGAIQTEDKTRREPTTGEMRRELAAIEARRLLRIAPKSLPSPTVAQPDAKKVIGSSED